ncbi:hypothetical protein [Limibacterium fermenti]|uniref:hypothetical protein n=1 Tax=Limibacterium fermenti TaxID=3229863 RepID=UPI003A64DC82
MKTITVNEIIEFKRKSERSKQTFALKVKLGTDESKLPIKGYYWSSSTSAINKSFKSNNLLPVKDKKEQLRRLYQTEDNLRKKNTYEKNIKVLDTFEDLDHEKWRPTPNLIFKKMSNKNLLVLNIKELDVKVAPSHIYTYDFDEKEYIGAIWFIAKKTGFKKIELGMFADTLYNYLNKYYSREYLINPQYCIAVDLVNGADVNYQELKDGEIPRSLNSTLAELMKMVH